MKTSLLKNTQLIQQIKSECTTAKQALSLLKQHSPDIEQQLLKMDVAEFYLLCKELGLNPKDMFDVITHNQPIKI